jgi:23S rRNA pseudouridine1911/1915/1917 synthase
MRMKAEVPTELDGERADRVVAVLAGLTRSIARDLVEEGVATFDGERVKAGSRVASGSVLETRVPEAEPPLAPEAVEFEVRYEDDYLAVVDKPSGVVVHPGAGHRSGTLAAGLLRRWPEIEGVGEPDRWGIVHRLDRDTSGVLVVALDPGAFDGLRAQMARREIQRSYLALVHGSPEASLGTIDAPLSRDPKNPVRFRVDPEGRSARTHYRLLAAWTGLALLEVNLETGRTHQIRVHLASIGHPVVSDGGYGRRDGIAPRLWLHAVRIRFEHPVGGDLIEIESPVPPELTDVLRGLGDPLVGALPTP